MSMGWIWELHPLPTHSKSSFEFALLCPFKAPFTRLRLLLVVLRMGELGLSSNEYRLALRPSPTPNQYIFKFLICPFMPFIDPFGHFWDFIGSFEDG